MALPTEVTDLVATAENMYLHLVSAGLMSKDDQTARQRVIDAVTAVHCPPPTKRLYVLSLTDMGATQMEFATEDERNAYLADCDAQFDDWYTLDVDVPSGAIDFCLATTGPDALDTGGEDTPTPQ